jgi:hypothetical protein
MTHPASAVCEHPARGMTGTLSESSSIVTKLARTTRSSWWDAPHAVVSSGTLVHCGGHLDPFLQEKPTDNDGDTTRWSVQVP